MTTAMTKRKPSLKSLEAMQRRVLLETQIDFLQQLYNPVADAWDPTTQSFWLPIGGGSGNKDSMVDNSWDLNTEVGLTRHRTLCRFISNENFAALNLLENLISYTVGTGNRYELQSKRKRDKVSPEELEPLQDALDELLEEEEEEWSEAEQEVVRRANRDGESIVRVFLQSEGRSAVRFVEPNQLSAKDHADESQSFGVVTDKDDVQSIRGYMIDGEEVPAGEVFHLRWNVDRNVKRGISTLWGIRRNLQRAETLLRCMSAAVGYQASISAVRKHTGVSQASLNNLVNGRVQQTVTNPATGVSTNYKEAKPGTVLDLPPGIDLEFPSQMLDVQKVVEALKAELRAAASRLVLPEFMFTSDASNGNFASTIVSEGPAHKKFERDQARTQRYLRKIMLTRLRHWVADDAKLAALLERCDLKVRGPEIASRDGLKDAQEKEILFRNDVLSRKTWSQQVDLDYELEQDSIDEDAARQLAGPPLPNNTTNPTPQQPPAPTPAPAFPTP